MTTTTLTKESIQLALACIIRGEAWQYQVDMELEKKMKVLHLGLQAEGRYCEPQWTQLKYIRPQSPPPQRNTSINKAMLTLSRPPANSAPYGSNLQTLVSMDNISLKTTSVCVCMCVCVYVCV